MQYATPHLSYESLGEGSQGNPIRPIKLFGPIGPLGNTFSVTLAHTPVSASDLRHQQFRSYPFLSGDISIHSGYLSSEAGKTTRVPFLCLRPRNRRALPSCCLLTFSSRWKFLGPNHWLRKRYCIPLLSRDPSVATSDERFRISRLERYRAYNGPVGQNSGDSS